jgi:hypothetical protein
MPLDDIKAQINKNTVQRLKKDADKAPQHTIYLGDRTVQRLGEEPIENAVILPNKALSIGEPLLPLASGDVLRRYDSANRGAYLGSAYRKALEADGVTGAKLSMNGDNAMPDEPLSPQQNGGGGNGSFPPISPPPFGCAPPDKKCFWTTASTPPNGFQGYGDVVTSTGDRLFLYCAIGTTPPSDLGCSFLTLRAFKIQQSVTAATSDFGSGTLGERCAIVGSFSSVTYQGFSYFTPPSSYPDNVYNPSLGGSCATSSQSKPYPASGTWALAQYLTPQGRFAILLFGVPSGPLSISVTSPIITPL